MSLTKLLTKLNPAAAQMELTDGSGCASKKSNNMQGPAKKTPTNKGVQGRRRFGGENGFEEGGGYMAVKKAKLDNQFNVTARGLNNLEDSLDTAEIFKGVSIYINGYVSPPEPELREIFILHGGTFHPYVNVKTTFVVATNLSAPSKQRYGSKTITPDWIMDSIAAGKPLDTRKYMLYNANQEKNQMTLTQIMTSKKSPTAAEPDHAVHQGTSVNGQGALVNNCSNGVSRASKSSRNSEDGSIERVSDSEEEFFECSQESFSTRNDQDANHSKVDESSNDDPEHSDKASNDIEASEINVDSESSNGSVQECSSPQKKSESANASNSVSPVNNKPDRIKTATDEGFLEDFFGRSRLHLISEQKKDMQTLVANMRKNIQTHAFTNLLKFESEFGSVKGDGSNGMSFSDDEVILMHVDLDCFFVSVGLLSRPNLRGKPVVVTHSSGKVQESKSDIACASYEARKFGVRNGMWVGGAKAMCPDLEVIPYDFEEYRRVSKLFFETVASVTLDIEAGSVDEMLLDVTSVLKKVPGATPEDLAGFLRRIIWNETQCPASIGIGSNRLLAKLAVKLAKPDGIHHLKMDEAPAYIQSLQVRDLPGVGWSNEGKLRELQVDTCGDLLKVPLRDLKATFGEKTAEKMHNLCRGIDTAEIKVGVDRPKSLSVDVNFGIRFSKETDITEFLMKICKELSTRADRIQAVCTHFTLKLLIRKKGAGDPLKHGGHGLVDSMTRSRTLLNPTRNWHEFFKVSSSLARAMRIPPSEYRGVGVTISDLAFDCDKSNKKSVQRTLTDMPISRAQKMLSSIISHKKPKVAFSDTSVALNKSDQESFSSQEDHTTDDVQSLEMANDNPTVVPDVTFSRNNHRAAVQNGAAAASGNHNQIERTNKSTATDVSKLPVDIAVLRQLPREIAEEQCQFYGISKDVLDESPVIIEGELGGEDGRTKVNGGTNNVETFYDNVETIDQGFLQALPENVRQDVLIQLQEAKGRRKIADTNAGFDDQQPCSSRQAIERSKKLELERTKPLNNDSSRTVSLAEQTTPIISYSNRNGSAKTDPKFFWDMTVDYLVVPPKPGNRPALNDCVEVGDVRDLIRKGLEVVTNPMPEEVEHLEKYFVQLISDGWMEQTQVLLKFLYRQAVQLGDNSRWTPVLHKIIASTQERCRNLYHGELEVE